MTLDLELPERFQHPGERDMAELQMYVDRYNQEVERVRNVCAYFVRNKLLKAKAPRMRVVSASK